MLLYKRVYAPAGFTSQLRHWKSARNSGLILNARYSYCYIPSDSLYSITPADGKHVFISYLIRISICITVMLSGCYLTFLLLSLTFIRRIWYHIAESARLRIDAFLIRSLIERNQIDELIRRLPHFSKPDALIF